MLVLKNAVFIDIPKCGCTSIFAALDRRPKPHWHQRIIPEEVADRPRFAVVRNPYHRALSMYHFEVYQCSIGNKRLHPGGAEAFYREWKLHSFDEFLKLIIENRTSQAKGFPGHYPNFLPCYLFLEPVQPIERVLHIETLQADWNATPYLPRIQIPHERRGTYEKTITPQQRDLIREWAAEDFEAYGYDRETYPKAA